MTEKLREVSGSPHPRPNCPINPTKFMGKLMQDEFIDTEEAGPLPVSKILKIEREGYNVIARTLEGRVKIGPGFDSTHRKLVLSTSLILPACGEFVHEITLESRAHNRLKTVIRHYRDRAIGWIFNHRALRRDVAVVDDINGPSLRWLGFAKSTSPRGTYFLTVIERPDGRFDSGDEIYNNVSDIEFYLLRCCEEDQSEEKAEHP